MNHTRTERLAGSRVRRIGSLATILLAVACKGKPPAEKAAPTASAAVPAPSARPITREDIPEELREAKSWPVATGPKLAILQGQGVGAVRLGANVATIERLMEMPCEIKTEESCRYIGRAVEFNLKNGVTSEIHIHRMDRPTTPKPRIFGVFNGRFPQGAALLMVPEATKQLLGQPLKVEPVKEGGEWNTVEVHHYKGMRLEFDRIKNGNVVLGGVVITQPDAKG